MSGADPLHDAAAIEDPFQRALALAQAAEQVPEDQRGDFLTQGLRAAYQVDDPATRSKRMISIAARLGPGRGARSRREGAETHRPLRDAIEVRVLTNRKLVRHRCAGLRSALLPSQMRSTTMGSTFERAWVPSQRPDAGATWPRLGRTRVRHSRRRRDGRW
jgi:hypothetical protein